MKNFNRDVPFISFLRREQIKDYSKINDNYQYTLVLMIIIIITLIDNGALQGQYKQIDISVVNKHDDNVLNIPTDQLAIYKVQPRS